MFVGPFVRKQDRSDFRSPSEGSTSDATSASAISAPFTNLYVKGLSERVTDERLRAEFEKFGAIVSAVVMRDQEGKTRGFGFVNFQNADDAARAVEGLNGKVVEEEEEGEKKEESEEKGASEEKEKSEDKEKSEEKPSENGEVTEGEGASAGEESESRKKEGGKKEKASAGRWYVGKAQRKAEREAELRAHFESKQREKMERAAGSNLYLKNIDEGVTEAKLREIFGECGRVTSCKVRGVVGGGSGKGGEGRGRLRI